MRAIVSSDYRAHSAPVFANLANTGAECDIFQVNSFQIVKFMFCYHRPIITSNIPDFVLNK